jgi:hypothetical protein
MIAAGLGILVRLGIAAVSYGTNDAAAWITFAGQIHDRGLLNTYRTDVEFNHPPIAGLWAMIADKAAGESELLFTVFFKLAPIGADAVAVWLLWKLWRRRGYPRAAMVAAAFAWSLASILVSGFHCNTDPVYAMLCLLAVYCIEEHGWHFCGGLALAAAINVKLIPVLLIAPLLLSYRNWRGAARFIAGLSLGVLPFVPVLASAPKAFVHNAVAYGSTLDRWGINLLLLRGRTDLEHVSGGVAAAFFYYGHARLLIVASIAAWAIIGRWLGRWNRYELCAVTFAIFLVLTPGFGVQYVVMLVPLLFALRPAVAFVYSTVAGLFLLGVYYNALTDTYPLYAHFHTLFWMPAAVVGLLAWGTLICFVVSTLWSSRTQAPLVTGSLLAAP